MTNSAELNKLASPTELDVHCLHWQGNRITGPGLKCKDVQKVYNINGRDYRNINLLIQR